jgi:hypothetical protein
VFVGKKKGSSCADMIHVYRSSRRLKTADKSAGFCSLYNLVWLRLQEEFSPPKKNEKQNNYHGQQVKLFKHLYDVSHG